MDTCNCVTHITNTNAGPSETILICHHKVDQTLHVDLSVSLGVEQSPDLVGDKPAGADEYELEKYLSYSASPHHRLSNKNVLSFKLWPVSLSPFKERKSRTQHSISQR